MSVSPVGDTRVDRRKGPEANSRLDYGSWFGCANVGDGNIN